MEVGVGHEVAPLGGVLGVDVALQRRHHRLGHVRHLVGLGEQRRRGVRPVRVAVVGRDHRVAVLESHGLGERVRIGVVPGMELAKEVLGLESLGVGGREVREQARLRRRENELHRLRIDDLDLHALSRHQHVVLRLRDDVGVQREVVVPELDVLGGEGRAVGPPVTLAEIKGQLGEVLIPLPALGHVRHDGAEIVGVTHQVHVAHGQEVGGARLGGVGEDVQGAAVAADLLVGNGNQGLLRQALGERRKLRVAHDPRVEIGDRRILLEGERAARERLELGELVLLGMISRRNPHRVGEGDGRAVGGEHAAGQEAQAGSDCEETLFHGDAP